MRHTMPFRIIIAAGVLLVLSGCQKQRHVVKRVYLAHPQHEQRTVTPQNAPDTNCCRTITVWVHGTRIFPNDLFKETFKETPSIKHYLDLDPSTKLHTIASQLIAASPEAFFPDDYYVFGWSGELSFNVRRKTARLLFDELKRIQQEYNLAHGHTPKIRIICHSHGGNVALHMADCQTNGDVDIIVDELVLLACPVQMHTKHCIKSPIFKSIYALSSSLDFVQLIDPQGLYSPEGFGSCGLFSERFFQPSSRLTQATIKMHKRAITHHEFVQDKFLNTLTIILEELRVWNKQWPIAESDNTLTTCLIDITNKPPKISC